MNARFLSPLDARHIGARRKMLLENLVYRDSRGRVFVVPAGFVSDGASVPRPLWVLYPPFGEAYEPAAWLHDYLYANAESVLVDDVDGFRPVNRREADALLEEASDAAGFRSSGSWILHAGVRFGGWVPWGRYRRRAVAAEV